MADFMFSQKLLKIAADEVLFLAVVEDVWPFWVSPSNTFNFLLHESEHMYNMCSIDVKLVLLV